VTLRLLALGVVYAGFGLLLCFETESAVCEGAVIEKLKRGTHTAASTNEFMSSWDVTSQ
jgi:hypothetical protein